MSTLAKIDIDAEALQKGKEIFQVLQRLTNCPEEEIPVKKISRGYVDGAFDLVHSGHFNAIR